VYRPRSPWTRTFAPPNDGDVVWTRRPLVSFSIMVMSRGVIRSFSSTSSCDGTSTRSGSSSCAALRVALTTSPASSVVCSSRDTNDRRVEFRSHGDRERLGGEAEAAHHDVAVAGREPKPRESADVGLRGERTASNERALNWDRVAVNDLRGYGAQAVAGDLGRRRADAPLARVVTTSASRSGDETSADRIRRRRNTVMADAPPAMGDGAGGRGREFVCRAPASASKSGIHCGTHSTVDFRRQHGLLLVRGSCDQRVEIERGLPCRGTKAVAAGLVKGESLPQFDDVQLTPSGARNVDRQARIRKQQLHGDAGHHCDRLGKDRIVRALGHRR